MKIITPQDERWPLLEMPSQPCSIPISPEDEAAIAQMNDLLIDLGDSAVGLAAVQIGYPKQIFLLKEGGENNVYINPCILKVSKELKKDGEGCLSLPGMGVVFKRPKTVDLQYYNISGELKTKTFHGLAARAALHEMNHLGGRLISKELEKQMMAQPKRSKFGMVLSQHRINKIEARRAKKKRAKRLRSH